MTAEEIIEELCEGNEVEVSPQSFRELSKLIPNCKKLKDVAARPTKSQIGNIILIPTLY